MNRLLSLLFAAAFLCGCSTNFTEYRGRGVIEGKGGTVTTAGGIDIWKDGEPDRKYKILGVITDERPNLTATMLTQVSDCTKMARERGADGLIVVSGAHAGTSSIKLYAVKYLPDDGKQAPESSWRTPPPLQPANQVSQRP